MTTCNARQTNGMLRCELDRGHRSDHGAEVQGDRSRVLEWVTWPNLSKGGARVIQRAKPIRKQSDKQRSRTSFIYGIKAERVRAHLEMWGAVRCEIEECGRPVSEHAGFIEPPDDLDGAEAIEWWMGAVDAHHIVSRDRGRGYYASNVHGIDSPLNIKLAVRACHRETEPEPEWSGRETT